jgi:hypothetical protein
MHGTMDQEDRFALEAAQPIYRWLREHQDYFVGQQSAARVLLMGRSQNTLRGLFRFLSEEHIPFGVVDNLDWIGKRDVDLVIAADEAPKGLEAWVRGGGRLLLTGTATPPMDLGKPVKLWQDIQGYFRIRDHSLFPSLKSTNLAFVYGDYLEVQGASPVTFIPPSMFGPPELVHVDWKDTDAPGLILKDYGQGRVAWLPWDIGSLYYQHSSETHAGLLRDLTDHLLPHGRQLKTNAHPLVETVLMQQSGRRLVHFVNLSGHSQTAYFDAVPMSGIQVQVAGAYRSAKIVSSAKSLPVRQNAGYTEFTLPALAQYELVELR